MKSMTFNILCAGRGENHWVFRQKLVKEIIKKYAPDTFGLQEVHYAWMRYIINQFKADYDFVIFWIIAVILIFVTAYFIRRNGKGLHIICVLMSVIVFLMTFALCLN